MSETNSDDSMTRNEKVFLLIVSIAMILLTTFPYVVGYALRPEQTEFTALHNFTTGDTATYYSFIEQAREGKILFSNLYTSEPQHDVLLSPLWLVVGNVARVFNLSATSAFQLARIALIPFFVYVAYQLIAFFVDTKRMRYGILLLLLLSGGLGMFFSPLLGSQGVQSPVDLWVPESLVFLSLYHSPLLIASWTLMLATFLLALRAWRSQQFRKFIYAGVTASALFILHPFYVPTIFLLVGVWGLMFWRQKKLSFLPQLSRYILFIGATLPSLIYFAWLYGTQDTLREWATTNILSSPSIIYYIIGFGLLSVFSLVGVYTTWQNFSLRLVSAWLIVNTVLLYLPFDFQRRLVEGIHVPLVIVAAFGMQYLYNVMKQRNQVFVAPMLILCVLLLCLNSVVALQRDISLFRNNSSYPFYIPQQDRDAFTWLKENTPRNSVILSGVFWTGNFIPAYAVRTVYVGHGPQTIDLNEKIERVGTFFAEDTTDTWRREFLESAGITHVLFSPTEKMIGPFDPSSVFYLHCEFQENNTFVYSVLTNEEE